MSELWLRDESDDPQSMSYGLDYHTGCMIQPPVEKLVERVNQMHSRLDAESDELNSHAMNAWKAEQERDWDSAYHEYTKFIKVLHSVGFDELGPIKSFRRYGDYLYVSAWASIPWALYQQIKLGNNREAVKHFGSLRATRDDEISERLPMLAYASIDLHIRIIDWETSDMLRGRGQEGLAQVLAQRAVRDFPNKWLLNAETPAEATLCHLVASQHRQFGQYDKAQKWRSALREWLSKSELSLDAQVQIGLDDVYLLCDMDDFASASRKLLTLKQRISDHVANNVDTTNFVQLRWVMGVDNAWWQCRRHLALKDSGSNGELPQDVDDQFATIEAQISLEMFTESNLEFVVPPGAAMASLPATGLLQEVAQPMSCTDYFTGSLRMIETILSVTSLAISSAASSSSSQLEDTVRDFFFDTQTGRTRTNPSYFPLFVQLLVELLENSGVNALWLHGSVAMRAERVGVWDLAYSHYQTFLTTLGKRDMPPPGSIYPGMYYHTLLIWAALPYALAYHTRFKDYEHSIWLLRNIQIVMEGFAPHPSLDGRSGVTTAAYVAVELQVRMAAWEWSCVLRDQQGGGGGLLETAEALSQLATREFPYQYCEVIETSEPLRVDEDEDSRAKASLCRLLANLYNEVAQPEEAQLWNAKLAKYVNIPEAPESHGELPRVVAGRVSRLKPGWAKYPRIQRVRPCIRHGNPPPRSSGSSTPERMFNADPNNSFI